MKTLLKLADLIDEASDRLGRLVMWAAGLLVLVQFSVVVLRYAYGSSFIWMQEGVVYLHAALFMLAIGYAYLHDGHVRVDVLYADWSPRAKALADLLGITIAVLPFCALVIWACWSYVSISWRLREGPMSVGGLPFLFVLKSLIPAMAVLLGLQAVAIGLRATAVLTGHATTHFPRKAAGGGHGG
jgi:TRAP-type mannitol/chloroaromatic compound transport system permease small subunit